MSKNNVTAEVELDEEELTEEVVSEQTESEEDQDVANLDNETEQSDETDDNSDLIEALSGKAEPEENGKTRNIPRSTAKVMRKNKRLEAQIERQQQLIEQLKASQPDKVQPKIPERDWDNETDEQYQFRITQAALMHSQAEQDNLRQHDERKKHVLEQEQKRIDALTRYNEESEKLKVKDYQDVEDRVLDGMHDLTLATMSSYNAEATPKIIMYLDANPDVKERLSRASHNDLAEFNRLFGKLEAKVEDIEKAVKQKRKSVSRAPEDKAIGGNSSEAGLQARMQKAADSGNFDLYRKLKAQLYKK